MMSVETCVEHLFALVIFDLGQKTLALHVQIVLLAQRLPVLPLPELLKARQMLAALVVLLLYRELLARNFTE